jgi:zinc transporter
VNRPSAAVLDVPEASYGSDRHGLIWAYRFAPGAPARELDAQAAADWLAAPGPRGADGFLWLHFAVSNVASTRFLKEHLALPDLFYELMQAGAGSTRLEQDGPRLIAQLHDVLFGTGLEESHASAVTLCLEPGVLVTARRRPLRSVDRLRAAVKSGQPFRSSADLLGQLLRDQAEVLADIVRQVSARIDAIEDQLLESKVRASRRELGQLRRLLVRLQRLLAPEPAALFRLLSRPPAWIGEEDVQDLRQAAEEFSAAVGDSSSLAERVKLIQEELAALVNEQTGRTLFTLTVVTVMALPINLVAGLFGMNVGGVPLANEPHGFFVVVATLVAATGLIAWLAWRRPRD